MSWKDKIENGVFKITTGDGKVYKPLWKPGESSKEYNTTAHNFINLEGTLVDRKKPQSSKYPLTLWFQGEDNIEQAAAFLKSADDPRAWEVSHPLYGIINGQPLGIERNDSSLNVTVINVDFWESITEDYPDDDISVQDRIQAKALDVQSAGIKSFSSFKPETANIASMKLATNQTQGIFSKIAGNSKVLFQNAYTTAIKSADNLINAQGTAISKQQELYSLASGFDTPLQRKFKAFKKGLDQLVEVIDSKNDKYLYESMGATAIAAASQSAVNPLEDDYTTRTQIESVVNSLLEMYNGYLQVLDENQVSRYDVENTWNPNAVLQSELNDLIVDTIGNLQVLAFQARQERIVYTEKDTNLIVLVHRYVGLDADDKNIEKFREINKIKNDELFIIMKDRQIKYFA